MKKTLVTLLGIYVVTFGDYHLSNYNFYKYCKSGRYTSTVIHEKVGLSENYFVSYSQQSKKIRAVGSSFYLNDKNDLVDGKNLIKTMSILIFQSKKYHQ